MNFQQLRIIREAVRQDFNLTEVANALFTSQPGVSKHIRDLEEEIGVELFIRKGKRLLGLTPPGKELVPVVERILRDTQNLKTIADQFASNEHGNLTIATTHTQARYALPEVIKQFKQRYPKVHLTLHQGGPTEIAEMLVQGIADVGIATEVLHVSPALAAFPSYSWHHAVIVPHDHPLNAVQDLTLEAIAAYPIITYNEGYTGRAQIDRAFAQADLHPDFVLSAIDADVIKTYVEVGLGIGVIASMAFNPAKDTGLKLLNADHLFEKNTTYIAVHRGTFLREYAHQFALMLAPEIDESALRAAAESV
ncbi:MAG: CysB family HTH-type transcriptional regulator [Rhodocyclaceae bacterium]|nr:CysB family HTH-type transcriptional regulator [Rhodocyclaceae bacterium]